MLGILMPTEKKFFPLIQNLGANLLTMSTLLEKLSAQRLDQRENSLFDLIESLERDADSQNHFLMSKISSSLITPFYREDLHDLCVSLDDVADYLYGFSKVLKRYETDHPEIISLTLSIKNICVVLNEVLNKLSDLSLNKKQILGFLNSLKTDLKKSFQVYENALASLFESDHHVLSVIKTKEVLDSQFSLLRKCKKATEVIQGILIKYA